MNQPKEMTQAVAAGLLALLFALTSCGKSSTSSGAASSANGVSGAAMSLAQLIGAGSGSSAGILRANGLLRPASTAPSVNFSNTPASCPSGGGQTLNGTLAESAATSSSFTLTGNVTSALNACVDGANTFNGSWIEAVNLLDNFTPQIVNAQSVIMDGTIHLTDSNLHLAVNGQDCSNTLDFTVTFQSIAFTLPAASSSVPPNSGTLSYAGSLCGAAVSGSCVYSNTSPTTGPTCTVK